MSSLVIDWIVVSWLCGNKKADLAASALCRTLDGVDMKDQCDRFCDLVESHTIEKLAKNARHLESGQIEMSCVNDDR